MIRRELAIALRARVTWVAAALASLLVGHGFVLAGDLFAASSRSVFAGSLMQRELDPLAGIVRPTLGGAELAVALLVPIVAARILAVEKERGSFGAIALAARSTSRVVLAKLLAASCASLLVVAPAAILFAAFAAAGGHLDVIETGIALGGHLLHALLIACVALAAASWTRSVAQATTVAVAVSVASWAVEAGEGHAALAWLGPLEAMSVTRVLAPFEHGLVSLASVVWIGAVAAAAVALALVGAELGRAPARRATLALGVSVCALLFVVLSRSLPAYDWTEYRRASLPPAAVAGLRAIDGRIAIEVWMDREDSRRRQLERDVVAKLRLARPDIVVVMPLDDREAGGAPVHDETYGLIVLRVGDRSGETRSASRREIVTRIFEIAGRPLPDWSQAPYPGYPIAWGPGKTRLAHGFAYVGLPGMVLALGAVTTRRRRLKEDR